MKTKYGEDTLADRNFIDRQKEKLQPEGHIKSIETVTSLRELHGDLHNIKSKIIRKQKRLDQDTEYGNSEDKS